MHTSPRITSYRPGPKRLKSLTVRLVLCILGRALASASRIDADIAREVAEWEEGFSLQMKVLPAGPSGSWRKLDGRLRFQGSAGEQADLLVHFKNLESAFLILTPQMGIHEGFAQHRMSVQGDLTRCMSLVRCLNRVIAYLYPSCLSRRLLKPQPETNRKILGPRISLYLVGIRLGT